MPRKGSVPKRDVLPDPIHNSKLVTKLINKIMLDGKRGTAQRILYSAFDLVEQRSGRDALEVFEEAINNIMPVLEVKAGRVGGSNYQVPVEVRPERCEKTMEDRLANEILDAANNTGGAVKKREDTHKMAEANKAFAHYRW